jgi:hypothetical protein
LELEELAWVDVSVSLLLLEDELSAGVISLFISNAELWAGGSAKKESIDNGGESGNSSDPWLNLSCDDVDDDKELDAALFEDGDELNLFKLGSLNKTITWSNYHSVRYHSVIGRLMKETNWVVVVLG